MASAGMSFMGAYDSTKWLTGRQLNAELIPLEPREEVFLCGQDYFAVPAIYQSLRSHLCLSTPRSFGIEVTTHDVNTTSAIELYGAQRTIDGVR